MQPDFASLKDIAEIIAGFADMRLDETEFKYSVLQANSFSDFGELSQLQIMYRKKSPDENMFVQNEDILVKRLNPSNSFVVDNITEKIVATQSLFIIRPKGEVSSEYLAYLFEQKEILSQIEHISGTGLAIRAVTKEKLANAKIPIIPQQQQYSIGQLWLLKRKRKQLIAKHENQIERLTTMISNKIIFGGG